MYCDLTKAKLATLEIGAVEFLKFAFAYIFRQVLKDQKKENYFMKI